MVTPTLVFDTTRGEQVIKEQTVVIIKDIKLVDDVLGAVLADWSGRVDGVGGSCSSESQKLVSKEETESRTATSGGKFVKLWDVSNVDSLEVEEEFGNSGTGSDRRLVNKTGCVGNIGCKSELEGVVRSKSPSVRAKSRASNSLGWLRFSVTNKFDTAKLVSRFEVGIDFGANWNEAGLTAGVIRVGAVAFLTNGELI